MSGSDGQEQHDGVEAVLAVVELTREFYGVQEIRRGADGAVVRSVRCPMWESAKRLGPDGLAEDAFCRPHELYYQDWLDDIGLPVDFAFTRALGRGDGCCEWVIRDRGWQSRSGGHGE